MYRLAIAMLVMSMFVGGQLIAGETNTAAKKVDPQAQAAVDTAKTFFKACSTKDWAALEKVTITYSATSRDVVKNDCAGLSVVSVGEPFQKQGKYVGWYVPYKVKLATGKDKEQNLALRNDSLTKNLWSVDGGW